MANAFRSLFGRDDNNTFIALSINHLKNSIKTDPAIPLLIISLGILLTASSGSWDITNHLLNRPETFFSPPHAGLYSGVVLVLFGSLMTYRYHRHTGKISDIKTKKSLPTYLRLVIVGIVMLISAGPLDFAWHTAFGLDGLLSPPHAVLTMGLVLCSIGAFLGLIRKDNYYGRMRTKTKIMTNDDNYSIVGLKNISRNDTTTRTKRLLLYIIIAITAIWITVSGIIHMVSLPFSDTDYFKFNPNPLLAGLIATLCFPFLVSFMLFTSWEITKKFGMLSASGMVFIFINLVTTILPNENLVPMIPFYLLNVIPIILIDVLLSLPALGISSPILLSQTRKKIVKMLAGIVLGLTFFMLYFPLITHTYNEVSINPQPVWPSVTASIYFEMIDEMFPLLVVSSMAAGILGVIVSSKLTALALHDIHGMTK
jgi:multisubunit Na+/H+ antiporter MnhG subunit